MSRPDLVIIGGGVGGLVTASVAGQLGLKVTLIEKENRLGGDCLHYGCVPSKTLIRSAEVSALMRRGADFGLPSLSPEVDLGKVMDRVHGVIAEIQRHDDPERFRGYGVEVLFGAARFVGPHRVEVDGHADTIGGRRFVIATGSSPLVPPIDGLDRIDFLTNQNVFDQRRLPERLLVLGGGPIGAELAQSFARLGSRVAVLEASPQLLGKEDRDVADLLRRRFEQEGIEVYTDTAARAARGDGEGVSLECEDGRNLNGDALLVAVGRRANVDGLNLRAAGVEHGHGGIMVDRRLRTSQKHIYACGDVCGPYPFTHMAEYQAGVVISNAVFRWPKKTDYSAVPWVTYTDPEVARVGLNETEAREQNIDCQVLRFDFADIDRARAEGEKQGFAKILVRGKKIVGANVVGHGAGELLPELVLAMRTGVKIGAISSAIHCYPTLAEILRRSVNQYYSKKLFSPFARKLVRTINTVLP